MKIILLTILLTATAGAEPRRRALLIGINDYSASTMKTHVRHATPPGRDWPDLLGAVNDVQILQEMLVLLYGFQRSDIVTLTDQAATRAAILQSIERHLVTPAAKDDVLFFYFAGHGSQVRNTRSDELDQLDESTIPADSRLGTADIRDKELRRLFNRILDRGARLTILLDHCNSGSGARGLSSGAPARGVAPDLRDVRDPTDYGPLPEHRGALVISATQDSDRAFEMRDATGKMHGAFTWAFIHALRDAAPGESALDTYLRADARMRADVPHQEPVIAALPAVQSAPFLGTRTDRRDDRTVVAVEKVQKNGTVTLQGGWAHGLSVGTRLHDRKTNARVVVTAMLGLGRSEGRVEHSTTAKGALLDVVAWTPPAGRPLRVWIPRSTVDTETLTSLARRLASAASKRGVRWIADPTESTPDHLLRWNGGRWEWLAAQRIAAAADPHELIAKIPRGSSLFVQFPAAAAIPHEGMVAVTHPEQADYLVTGRYSNGTLTYAWVRPSMHGSDRRRGALPVRSAWVRSPAALRDHALRLQKIQRWQTLEPPPGTRAPYRLALRRNSVFVEGTLTGDQHYELVLRPAAAAARPRYVYAFVIDSHGAGTLLFPRQGSVENRFAQQEVALGSVTIGPPYGIDTYVLLTTEEPLPNPWIFSWEGVRSGLGALTSAWSIERRIFESVPP